MYGLFGRVFTRLSASFIPAKHFNGRRFALFSDFTRNMGRPPKRQAEKLESPKSSDESDYAPSPSTKNKRAKTDLKQKTLSFASTAPSKPFVRPEPFSEDALHVGDKKLMSWNVNGLRAVIRKEAFESYILKENPDFFFLNETKLDDSVHPTLDLSRLKEYEHRYWNCSKKKKGVHGVAFFSKEKPDRVELNIGDLDFDSEGRMVAAYFPKYILIGVYVPNSGQRLERLDYRVDVFEGAMRKYLNEIYDKYKDDKTIIYCGDLNVAPEALDVHDSKGCSKIAGHTDRERAAFRTFMGQESYKWKDVYRHMYPEKSGYTFYSKKFLSAGKTPTKGWRLDFFVTNRYENCHEVCIRENIDASDHFPITLYFTADGSKNETSAPME